MGLFPIQGAEGVAALVDTCACSAVELSLRLLPCL